MNYCVDIYKNFKCLADKCPDTCCFGWTILVDDETDAHYSEEPGKFGRTLRRNVHRMNERCIKKKINGRCPYEEKSGLCGLQLMGRTDCMPRVCREYPRRILDFGYRSEITLEMACPEVARLILENPRRLSFVEVDEGHDSLWTLENDDKSFLDGLMYTRERVLDIVWDEERSFSDCMRAVYDYSYRIHEILIKGSSDGMTEVESEINKTEFETDVVSKYFLYRFGTLDKLLVYNIADPRLSYAISRLHQRIKHYHKRFDDLNEIEALRLCEDTLDEMIESGIVNKNKYRAYLSFTIQQLYMTAYEDYYVLRPIILSLAYVQILMIVDVCTYLDGDDMSLLNQCLEMGSLERRMRHNEAVRDGMTERIRHEFMDVK